MRWMPRLKDINDIDNSGGKLITKAAYLCKKRLKKPIKGSIKDSIGVIGWISDNFYLVAKSYAYGWIVSCHKLIYEKALKNNYDIIMYIESSNKFYKFDPLMIKMSHKINKRKEQEMINFDIKLGENCEKISSGNLENG